MKIILLLSLSLILFGTGCGLQQREVELKKRTDELNNKEQELLAKERALEIKAAELAQKEQQQDSSASLGVDSFMVQHPQIPGKWNVVMRCTETTCAGSAVGDTKNEQWDMSYEGKLMVIRAFADNKLVRVYTGGYNGSSVELSIEQDQPTPAQTSMTVRFQEIEERVIRGQREIVRPDQCHIIYSLELNKQ